MVEHGRTENDLVRKAARYVQLAEKGIGVNLRDVHWKTARLMEMIIQEINKKEEKEMEKNK